MTQQPYVAHAWVEIETIELIYSCYKIVPANLKEGDTFNLAGEKCRILELMPGDAFDQKAWLHTLEVIRKINTISSTKTMAAYLVFANASPEESHFDTWSRAYQAAKAEPYAKWEHEGS